MWVWGTASKASRTGPKSDTDGGGHSSSDRSNESNLLSTKPCQVKKASQVSKANNRPIGSAQHASSKSHVITGYQEHTAACPEHAAAPEEDLVEVERLLRPLPLPSLERRRVGGVHRHHLRRRVPCASAANTPRSVNVPSQNVWQKFQGALRIAAHYMSMSCTDRSRVLSQRD